MPVIVLHPGDHIEVQFGEGEWTERRVRLNFDIDAARVFITDQFGEDYRKIYEDVVSSVVTQKDDGRPLVGMDPPEE